MCDYLHLYFPFILNFAKGFCSLLWGDVLQSSSMKIQEHPGVPEVKLQRNQEIDGQEDTFISEVPRLDLSTLCSDNWEGRIAC